MLARAATGARTAKKGVSAGRQPTGLPFPNQAALEDKGVIFPSPPVRSSRRFQSRRDYKPGHRVTEGRRGPASDARRGGRCAVFRARSRQSSERCLCGTFARCVLAARCLSVVPQGAQGMRFVR